MPVNQKKVSVAEDEEVVEAVEVNTEDNQNDFTERRP